MGKSYNQILASNVLMSIYSFKLYGLFVDRTYLEVLGSTRTFQNLDCSTSDSLRLGSVYPLIPISTYAAPIYVRTMFPRYQKQFHMALQLSKHYLRI